MVFKPFNVISKNSDMLLKCLILFPAMSLDPTPPSPQSALFCIDINSLQPIGLACSLASFALPVVVRWSFVSRLCALLFPCFCSNVFVNAFLEAPLEPLVQT